MVVGQLTQSLGLGLLPFTFPSLDIASIFYSLPIVVQPIQNAFETIGERPLEVAATLRACITKRSAENLQIRPGLALHAQIKAVALLA